MRMGVRGEVRQAWRHVPVQHKEEGASAENLIVWALPQGTEPGTAAYEQGVIGRGFERPGIEAAWGSREF